MKKVLLEAVLVAVIGTALALVVNAISPQGLALAKNYFPGKTINSNLTVPAIPPTNVANTNATASTPSDSVILRLKQNGLQSVDGSQAVQFFHDPRHEQELVIFVDTRNEPEFQAGHIPSAYLFDNYHPEKNLAEVMSAAQSAETVVVYCHGGDCDDSVSAAIALRDTGIPNQKLFVYTGGITEWLAEKLPVEIGERKSGALKK